MRGIRLSDRVLIAGQTGKGKTTLADYLVRRLQPVRVIVFDPKDELAFPGVETARAPVELVNALHGPVVHYVPDGFDRDAVEEACQIVWETPGPYVWWVDEAAELSSANYVPRGLGNAVRMGRKYQKMVLANTQRLAECHPVFRSQAEHVFIFVPPPIELDLKAIAGHVHREAGVLGRELAELHAEYGDFSHLWYVRDTDELRRCAPIPLNGTPAPAGTPRQVPAASAEEPPDAESAA